jgi:putative ABC transport system permease protein
VTWLRVTIRRIREMFSKRQLDAELDEELQAHLEMLAEENMQRGMPRGEALRAARIALGGVEQTKEAVRDHRGLPFLESLIADARFSARMLRKSPGFTAAAILTLALGIGANTATFSVASVFLWRPVSFPGLDRVVMVMSLFPGQSPLMHNEVAPADYVDWSRRSHSFEPMAVFSGADISMIGAGVPQKLSAFRVSSDFFPTLEVQPILGRTFRREEDQPGRDQEAVLSYGLWKSSFGGDPGVVGKTIQLDGRTVTIVGLMGDDFRFPPYGAQLWLPMAMDEKEKDIRDDHFLSIVTRLKPGVTLAQAQAEMSAIGERLAQEYPAFDKGWGVRVIPVTEFVGGSLGKEYSRISLVAAMFILLIVCANVANLLLARSTARRKEIAVRMAMGASRWRMVRLLLMESVLLGLGGCVFGLMLAQWQLHLIVGAMPAEVERYLPFWRTIHIDKWTLFFSLGIALFAGILAGIAPALRISMPGIVEQMKEGGRGATPGRARHRLRNAFVIAEVALSLVLMIGAGLMTKGVRELFQVQSTLRPETLLTLRIQLPESKYKLPPQRAAFYDQSLARLQTLPEVRSAAVATGLPYCDCFGSHPFSIQGKPIQPGEFQEAYVQSVSRDFFRTMNLSLRAGREFTAQDGQDAPPVAIISEDFARRYFPGKDPLGQRIKQGHDDSDEPWATIVGVVGQMQYVWTTRVDRPAIYMPYQQVPRSYSYFVMRSASDPMTLVPAIRSQIASVDPDQPIFDIATEAKVIHDSVTGLSYVAVMLSVMGAMALLLAALGVYGVMAYAVAERTHEIGIRMALGAERRDVLGMLVRRGAILTGLGVLIGLPAALALAKLLASLLFGVGATDLLIFCVGTLALAGIAMLACYVPARRAMRMDPLAALRYE